MKIAQIAGFLGSGKTTLLIELARELSRRRVRTALIVNDIGDVSVDARFLEDHGLQARQIADGCICCQLSGQLSNTLARLFEAFQPELVLIEPTGVALPWKIKRASEFSEGRAPTGITHAPVITLFDPSRIELLLKAVRRPVEAQLRDAQIIVINKVDAADAGQLARAREFVREVNASARVLEISALRGEGVDVLVDAILSEHSMRYEVIHALALAERGDS